jgi:hypothetical protein
MVIFHGNMMQDFRMGGLLPHICLRIPSAHVFPHPIYPHDPSLDCAYSIIFCRAPCYQVSSPSAIMDDPDWAHLTCVTHAAICAARTLLTELLATLDAAEALLPIEPSVCHILNDILSLL